MPSSSIADEALPLAPGEVLANKYRIERVLGRGGMGFVVAARNINLGKRVAIKMMLPGAINTPLAVERFEREARAAVQLKSEHIAEVLDIGKLDSGEPYIVMELLEGSDFEALLANEHSLSVEDSADHLLQVCEAVAEAHALGVVHRDLKPKNLFLSHRLDGTPVVKVLDFGISKWTVDSDSHSLTRTSDVFGSPNYMSPEQIRSARDVDARTDVWSLGVILFEMLTGRVPFVAETLPQLCALVLETAPPRVSELRADLPPGLVDIVARCLEKTPEARFQSVRELAAALEPFGRPRRQHRSARVSVNSSGQLPAVGTANFSPTAATIPANEVPSHSGLGSAPLSSTTGGSSLGVSMHGKMQEKKKPSRWLFALVAIPVVVISASVWMGLHRSAAGHLEPPDAEVVPTPSAATSVASTTPTALPSVAPSPLATMAAPSATTTPSASPPVPRHRVVVPQQVRADAGARVVTPPPPPTHSEDSTTPFDRK